MSFVIEPIMKMVLAMMLFILILTGILVTIAITRRKKREKYFRRIDEVRICFSPLVAGLLAGTINYEQGLKALSTIKGIDRLPVLEQLLLEGKPKTSQLAVLRRLCEDLGLVKVWQRQLIGPFNVESLPNGLARPEGIFANFGRISFVGRATSAQNLGAIRHQPSCPLLIRALRQDHPDVGSVAARSLAAIGGPESFQALLNQLYDTILQHSPRLSLRTIMSALISFPLDQALKLLPLLEHPHSRIRFVAVDIIRGMTERLAETSEDFNLDGTAFAPELTEIFLGCICFDVDSHVRARAASVIACLVDPRATPALCTLLDDSHWVVRFHAARAMGNRRYASQAIIIASRLTDTHWKVREAATHSLLAFGPPGLDQLFNTLVTTRDHYSKEQIADEIQRAGLIPELLCQYVNNVDGNSAIFPIGVYRENSGQCSAGIPPPHLRF